jgi:20S proteasome subunit alpha 7
MGRRPIGTSAIIASYEKINGLTLWMVEPSGQVFQYYGCASGRGKQIARNEIEKTNYREMTCDDAIPKLVTSLLKAQDDLKPGQVEIEISVIRPDQN